MHGFERTIGSRSQVWHGTAYKTKGGLTKSDLFQDKYGRIRSKKASYAAKDNNNLGSYKKPKGSHGFSLAKKKSAGRRKSGVRRYSAMGHSRY